MKLVNSNTNNCVSFNSIDQLWLYIGSRTPDKAYESSFGHGLNNLSPDEKFDKIMEMDNYEAVVMWLSMDIWKDWTLEISEDY